MSARLIIVSACAIAASAAGLSLAPRPGAPAPLAAARVEFSNGPSAVPPAASWPSGASGVLRFVPPLDPAKGPTTAADPQSLKFTGTVRHGQRALALISGPDGVARALARGEAIDGWTVAQIDGARVVLQRGRQTVEKRLFDTTAPPAAVATRPSSADDRGLGAAAVPAGEPASAPPLLPPPAPARP